MPDSRTVTIYICINPDWVGIDGLDHLQVFTADPRDSEHLSNYVAIDQRDITVEVPGKERLNQLQIDVLERQVQRQQAEHHRSITNLKERIQSLRALPFMSGDE